MLIRLNAEGKLDADVTEVIDEIADERIAERGIKCNLHHRSAGMTEDEARYGRDVDWFYGDALFPVDRGPP